MSPTQKLGLVVAVHRSRHTLYSHMQLIDVSVNVHNLRLLVIQFVIWQRRRYPMAFGYEGLSV